MAAEETAKKDEPQGKETEGKNQRKSGRLVKLLRHKWTGLLLLITLATHGAGFMYYQGHRYQTQAQISPEVSLGEFRFIASEIGEGGLAEAGFRLHVSLLSEAGVTAQQALSIHQFRIQQDIEQLLRQAREGDFEDPSLTELKRQIQETINRTLGNRVIAEVIITDLEFERVAGRAPVRQDSPTGEVTATDASWEELPAS